MFFVCWDAGPSRGHAGTAYWTNGIKGRMLYIPAEGRQRTLVGMRFIGRRVCSVYRLLETVGGDET